ncbi:MAG TPA: hypothetical protein VFS96_06275 [Nitrolancea sp.]|nr:hypothetical protein [Nitrolancea sp.]
MVLAIAEVLANNHEPNIGIMAPRTKATIAKLADATGQPLDVPPVTDNLD